MNIKCVKCGKEKEFISAAQIWTEGWNPINKNEYVCDKCPQNTSFNELDFLPELSSSELPLIDPEDIDTHHQKNKKPVV